MSNPMAASTLSTLFSAATDSRVDAENGILRSVRVITKGEAKGHSFLGEPIIVDDTTLDEVVTAAAGFADGVPVKLAHGTDIEELIGSIRDIVRDGDCVRGDLYLLKSHESYVTVLEMAQTMPSNFGLSISFMNAPVPVLGNDMEPDGDEDDADEALRNLVGDDIVAYAARVCELYSADLVQAPACNPSLFSAMSEPTAIPEAPAEVAPEVSEVVEVTHEIPAEAPSEASAPEETPSESSVVEELEVKGPEGTQNLPEDQKEASPSPSTPAATPAPAELSRNLNALTSEFESTKTELSRVTTELASVRTELEAARGEIGRRDAELTELRFLHRSVLSVMNLGASIELPETATEESAPSITEQYEKMPAGPERLAFFETHRAELFKALQEAKK